MTAGTQRAPAGARGVQVRHLPPTNCPPTHTEQKRTNPCAATTHQPSNNNMPSQNAHLQEPGVFGRHGCLHSTGTNAPTFATASYRDDPAGSSAVRPLTVTCMCLGAAAAAVEACDGCGAGGCGVLCWQLLLLATPRAQPALHGQENQHDGEG